MRYGIEHLVERTHRRIFRAPPNTDQTFAAGMQAFPIAEHVDAANAQHYELPAEFFGLVLGPHRKYSSCLYASPSDTLAKGRGERSGRNLYACRPARRAGHS